MKHPITLPMWPFSPHSSRMGQDKILVGLTASRTRGSQSPRGWPETPQSLFGSHQVYLGIPSPSASYLQEGQGDTCMRDSIVLLLSASIFLPIHKSLSSSYVRQQASSLDSQLCKSINFMPWVGPDVVSCRLLIRVSNADGEILKLPF